MTALSNLEWTIPSGSLLTWNFKLEIRIRNQLRRACQPGWTFNRFEQVDQSIRNAHLKYVLTRFQQIRYLYLVRFPEAHACRLAINYDFQHVVLHLWLQEHALTDKVLWQLKALPVHCPAGEIRIALICPWLRLEKCTRCFYTVAAIILLCQAKVTG